MPHLNQMERYQIYAYRESSLSLRAIAKHLGRHHSVICRKLSRNRDNGVLVTLVERFSKYTLIARCPSKHAQPVTQAIIQLLTQSKLPVHSITFNNGKEFAQHQTIANALNTECFFLSPITHGSED